MSRRGIIQIGCNAIPRHKPELLNHRRLAWAQLAIRELTASVDGTLILGLDLRRAKDRPLLPSRANNSKVDAELSCAKPDAIDVANWVRARIEEALPQSGEAQRDAGPE